MEAPESIDKPAPGSSEPRTEFEPQDPPEWINDTPDRIEEYQLAMAVSGTIVQFMYLSREEFISLKQHLAGLRGLTVQPEAKAA